MAANKESIISRVQKLLNLAMDSGATDDERKLAQERADKLMVEHMIEQSELKKDDPNRSRATNAEWRMNLSTEFRIETESLLMAVISHTKCRAMKKVDWSDRENPHRIIVVGMPEQIAYAERLWLITFTEMARNLYPKWDHSLTFDTNVYNHVKAGFKWREIHEIVWKELGAASGLPDPYPADLQPAWNPRHVYGGKAGKLKTALHREQKRLGEERENHTNRHSAYRRSYVKSYTGTIRTRLFRMAKESREAVSDSDRYALALRSTEDQTNAEFYRLFPEFDPENIAKADAAYAAREMARRAAMTQAQRDREDRETARRYRSARRTYASVKDTTYDSNGWARGSKVAEKVNLNNDTPIKHTKKEIR
jgi:hypothetical protein